MTAGLSARDLRGLAGIAFDEREQVLGDGHAVSISHCDDAVFGWAIYLECNGCTFVGCLFSGSAFHDRNITERGCIPVYIPVLSIP